MPIGGKDAFLSKVTFRRESKWYFKTKQELKYMETIEERANLAAWQIFEEIGLSQHSVERVSEIIEEKMLEQKKIDNEKACNIFCHTGCPHKTDSYNCLKDRCDALKAFKRMMAE